MPARTLIAALLLALAPVLAAGWLGAAPSAEGGGRVLPVIVEGSSLFVLARDGRQVAGQALVGAVVVGGDAEGGGRNAFRIDRVWTDPDDPEVTLHDLSTRDPRTGEWKPYCVPDTRGVAAGLFLAGSWDARGTHLRDDRFSVTCTSGVIDKCVRAGYKPWQTAPDGRPMWDYHQACTRMMRADYCGDGKAYTREGTPIEILSRLDPAEEPHGGLVFEAGWTPEGASCVAKARLSPSPWPLEAIAAECPERLRGRIGDPAACTATTELARPEVLLVSKSRP